MAIDKYNHKPDAVDFYIKQDKRIKSLERNVSGLAMATSYMSEVEPWPSEMPNGEHAAAVGVLWFNPADSSVKRWSQDGEWVLVASWPAQKSFWQLSTGQSIAGTGANVDINTWIEDGDTNSYFITMDVGQNITVHQSGLYRIAAGLGFPVNATGRRYIQIFSGTSGGSVIASDYRGTSSTGVVTPQVNRVVRLEAEDVFRVTANQDSGSALALLTGNNYSYLQVTYEGMY